MMTTPDIALNFPSYDFQITDRDGKAAIFDPIRKKFIRLTPEEWVRQHVIQYLATEKNVPLSLMKVESEIILMKTKKRFDIAVFDRNGKALLVVECKAPSVNLSQNELDQAVRYNMALQVKYLMLTNGLVHIFCKADSRMGNISLIEGLPLYAGLCQQG